jgi:hypothetical protein
MSRQSDLLGLILDTAVQPADDEPGLDSDGRPTLETPADADDSEYTQDDAAYEGLRDSGLSPEEAQAEVDFMRPLDDEEAAILEDTPGLEGLTRVDDSEHEQWIDEKAGEGYRAMDRAAEDAVFGEQTMSNDEEMMERSDTDSESGLNFRRTFKKIGRGLKRVGKVAVYPMTKVVSTAARFIPGRDARKAALVRNTYKKLWYEHANWLAVQDKNSGIPLKPRAEYERVAKMWAVAEMKKNRLPTNFNTGGADILGAELLGETLMGSWAWPFGNFLNFSRTTIKSTDDKRTASPPAEQADQSVQPGMTDVTDPSLDPPADPAADPGAPPPDADVPQPDSQGETMDGIEDSLGAFATQILGTGARPAENNPYAEDIVKRIAVKLGSRKAITPGELGLLASAAKEGNASARKVMGILTTRGVAVPADSSGLDPWMYKLSPGYWFASKQKKGFIDAEKKNWMDNYRLSKEQAKRQDVLDQAERARQSSEAVAAARAQAAATEAQLKEIADSLKGAMSGSFVGHEKVTPISDVVIDALEKTGKKDEANRLYAKIREGEILDKTELKEARKIAKIIGAMRVVHGDIVSDKAETSDVHGAFVGACVLGNIEVAREANGRHTRLTNSLSERIASGQTLDKEDRAGLIQVLRQQKTLHAFKKSLVSGRAFVGCPERKTWTRGAFIGAARSLGPEDQKMLATIVKMAKLGNPRAQKALDVMRKSGEISGSSIVGGPGNPDDFLGFSVKKFFKYATAPIWLPAKGVYKAAQGLGIASKGGGAATPEQVRLAKMRAAYQRRQAATARAAAADAQSDAEQRAQQAIADAADAEADAADADAFSKEQKMKTAEAEANPDTIPSVGSEDFIGATDAELDTLMKNSYAKPAHVAILKKAGEKSATGTKIRAGANLVTKARSKDPRIRFPAAKAIKIMASKAKKGDPQAQRDLNAVKAGRIAIDTKGKLNPAQYAASVKKWDKKFAASASKEQRQKAALATKEQKKKAALAAREARKARLIAYRKRYESALADRLARASRSRELAKLAKVERMAAQGHPKARAFVASREAAAKKGDRKARAQVQGMRLGKCVRTQVKTSSERQNMQFAKAMVRRLAKNDPRAIRQLRIWQDAAAKGNPNAIRCLRRLALAGAVQQTIATGSVVLPKAIGKDGKTSKSKPQVSRKQKEKMVAQAKERAASGTATREELTAGGKIAHEIGDKESAGKLTNAASTAPSATEAIKREANTVAAAQSGNVAAKAKIAAAVEGAKTGNVDDIKTLGNVAAAKTIDAVDKGQPIPPVMAESINMQIRAKAGDPVAQETLRNVSEAATQPNPSTEATLAATAAVGGAVIVNALANRPKAMQELQERINPPIPAGEKAPAQAEVASALAKAKDGTITAEEAVVAERLAMRLGQPRLAAEIAAAAPPIEQTGMSSLPDRPLPPINGPWQLLKESAKALTFTTRDPIANYREGSTTKSRTTAAVTSSGRWSVFSMFRGANKLALLAPIVPGLAPVVAASAAATAISNRMRGGQSKAPAPAPQAVAKEPAPQATKKSPTPDVEKPEASETAGVSLGSDEDLERLMDRAVADDQLDRLMTRVVQDDGMIRILKLLQRRHDLRKRIDQRAASGPPALGKISIAAVLADKARAGDTDAKKKLVDWCSTPKHDSSGAASDKELDGLMDRALTDDQLERLMVKAEHQADLRARIARAYRDRGTFRSQVEKKAAAGNTTARALMKAMSQIPVLPVSSSGASAEGKSEFKRIISTSLKTKKLSRDDLKKALASHVDPKASDDVKKAAADRILSFLKTKDVKIS